jgi:hypothetical protein
MSENNILDLLLAILPYGYGDLDAAVIALNEAKIDYSDFGEYVAEFCNDTDCDVFKLDICALVYEFILQNARRNIEEETGHDILNDVDFISVSGNYMCSSFDYTDAARRIILGWIKKIPNNRLIPETLFMLNNLQY